MFKHTDLPHPLRPLAKEFCNVAGYQYRPSEVFDDFISYCLYSLNMRRSEVDKEWYESMKAKYGKHYQSFVIMWHELLACYNANIDRLGWYDPLGDFYMEVSARSTQSAFGQFFTPMDVCQLMVEIQFMGKDMAGKGLKINDCAAGSGRLLLAFHALSPGNFMYAEDLDALCAKMSIINMAFHGCVGQVRKMDTLSQQFHWGYAVNPLLTNHGILGIWPLNNAHDEYWLRFQPNRPSKETGNDKGIIASTKPKEERPSEPIQLSLF